MPTAFTTKRRVEFCETDAAGIVHFASFLCYMEQAEHQLLRSLGTSVVQPLDVDGESDWHLSWPRVHVECDFAGAAKFEDELTIKVDVLRLGEKSITYGFSIANAEQPIATGKVVAVCCRVKSGQPLVSTAIPDELAAKLKQYLRKTDTPR